jgi:hypothetical protein
VPSGSVMAPLLLPLPDMKDAKAEGVRDVASAGGGRPVILATRVRSQRRRVKMPRTEPRVLRRLPNCSATETIAPRESA